MKTGKCNIELEIGEDKIRFKAPYHIDLPKKARRIGGEWEGFAWSFDKRDLQRAFDKKRHLDSIFPRATWDLGGH